MASDGPPKEPVEHIERPGMDEDIISEAAARQIQYEKQLSFAKTLRIFWKSTLWVCYGQLVVFGYGIDGNVAGNLLAIPKFR